MRVRPSWRNSSVAAVRSALALALLSAPALAAEPELRLEKSGDALVASFQADPGDPAPDLWNLYRGDLVDLGLWLQRGNPDGRCAIPAQDLGVTLQGELVASGAFYYLVSTVDANRIESSLGFDSLGSERPNNAPCPRPADCFVSGRAVNPGVDWAALHGRAPAVALPVPTFAAFNQLGEPRGAVDLLGHPTVLWFYPAAGTGG